MIQDLIENFYNVKVPTFVTDFLKIQNNALSWIAYVPVSMYLECLS